MKFKIDGLVKVKLVNGQVIHYIKQLGGSIVQKVVFNRVQVEAIKLIVRKVLKDEKR